MGRTYLHLLCFILLDFFKTILQYLGLSWQSKQILLSRKTTTNHPLIVFLPSVTIDCSIFFLFLFLLLYEKHGPMLERANMLNIYEVKNILLRRTTEYKRMKCCLYFNQI